MDLIDANQRITSRTTRCVTDLTNGLVSRRTIYQPIGLVRYEFITLGYRKTAAYLR